MRQNLGQVLLLTVIVLIFFWQTIVKGLLPIPADALVGLYHPFRDYFAGTNPNGVAYKNFILTDPVLQQYPWKQLVISQWKNILGTILKGYSLKDRPFDNLYSFGGYAASSLENIQAGVFYPLNIVFFIVRNFSVAWTVFIILQPILSSIFMYLWLKNNRLSKISSLFGGIVWAFSSFNLVWLEWGNIGHVGLWLPLALLSVDKITKAKTWKWHLLLQFSMVSSLFAGHWQISLYLLAAVAIYVIVVKRLSLVATRLSLNKLLMFFVHCFLFITLTSIQWFPSLKFTLSSNRDVEQQDALNREGFFIRPRQLAQLISPDFFGNPATLNYRGVWNYAEQIIYIGIIPFLLAIVSVFTTGQSSRRTMTAQGLKYFGLILVIGGLIFSVKNPISEIPYRLNIPMWSDLQPTRLSYLITFGLAILAALGLQSLINKPKLMIKKTVWVCGLSGLLLLSLLIISSKFDFSDKMVSQRNLIFSIGNLMVFGISVSSFFLLKIRNSKSIFLFSVFCFLFSILDLFRFGWKFTPFSPGEYLYPVTPAIKYLQNNMRENDRYMTVDRRILPPNANIIYKLRSIEGYDPIYSKDYASLITAMEGDGSETEPVSFGRIVRPKNYRSPISEKLDVRYVLSLSDISDPNLTKVFQEGETRVYEVVSNIIASD